jgi:hypothetical protein
MMGPFEVGPPLSERNPDDEKFFVINVIVELSRMHQS